MNPLTTTLLFFATAIAEIVGCYLPMLWIVQGFFCKKDLAFFGSRASKFVGDSGKTKIV